MNIRTHRISYRAMVLPVACSLALLFIMPLAGPALADDGLRYADRTPGQKRIADGHRAYRARQYMTALQHYQRAAYWADKFGHYNVGVMHYHGKGAEQDVPRAWAWFELAAEREYPQFRELADLVWSRLDEYQRQDARRILEDELKGVYGDEVAVARTSREMARQRRLVTGSRVGHVGRMSVAEVDGYAEFDNRIGFLNITYVGQPAMSGEQYYNRSHWDFNRIVELESNLVNVLHSGNVTLRDFELIEDDSAPE